MFIGMIQMNQFSMLVEDSLKHFQKNDFRNKCQWEKLEKIADASIQTTPHRFIEYNDQGDSGDSPAGTKSAGGGTIRAVFTTNLLL